jgi:hypothetical protein
MICKVIILEFIVPTVLAVALAIVLSVGAVHLANAYLGPADQLDVHRIVAESPLLAHRPTKIIGSGPRAFDVREGKKTTASSLLASAQICVSLWRSGALMATLADQTLFLARMNFRTCIHP